MVVSSGVTVSDCADPKAGYCVKFSDEITTALLTGDFGWEASPVAVEKTGRYDYVIFADKAKQCTVLLAHNQIHLMEALKHKGLPTFVIINYKNL